MVRAAFVTTTILLASLAGVSAQTATTSDTATAGASTGSDAGSTPTPTADVPAPTGQRISRGPNGTTTFRLYDPTASNIPSDGWILSGPATLDGHTHTVTQWVGKAHESWTAYRDENDRVHYERNAWRDATIGMGAVTGVTALLTGVFAVLHARLRAAERWRSLDASAAEAARFQAQAAGGPLPGYDAERPPSYAASRRSSSSSRRAASAAAVASLLPGARAYGVLTYYPHGYETTSMSELPATSSHFYTGEMNETRDEIPRYRLATCVGLLVPCLFMWAYIAYVIYRLVRSKRATRGFLDDRQAPPMPENHMVIPFPTQERQEQQQTPAAPFDAAREKAMIREKLEVQNGAGSSMPLSPAGASQSEASHRLP